MSATKQCEYKMSLVYYSKARLEVCQTDFLVISWVTGYLRMNSKCSQTMHGTSIAKHIQTGLANTERRIWKFWQLLEESIFMYLVKVAFFSHRCSPWKNASTRPNSSSKCHQLEHWLQH